jgi:hypothetical protein
VLGGREIPAEGEDVKCIDSPHHSDVDEDSKGSAEKVEEGDKSSGGEKRDGNGRYNRSLLDIQRLESERSFPSSRKNR